MLECPMIDVARLLEECTARPAGQVIAYLLSQGDLEASLNGVEWTSPDHARLALACLADDGKLVGEILRSCPELLNKPLIPAALVSLVCPMVQALGTASGFNLMPPLHGAVSAGAVHVVDTLLALPGIEVNQWNKPDSHARYWFPLFQATWSASRGDIEGGGPFPDIARKLLAAGGDPFLMDYDGISPLSMALLDMSRMTSLGVRCENTWTVLGMLAPCLSRPVLPGNASTACLVEALENINMRGEFQAARPATPDLLAWLEKRTGVAGGLSNCRDILFAWLLDHGAGIPQLRDFVTQHFPVAEAFHVRGTLARLPGGGVSPTPLPGRARL